MNDEQNEKLNLVFQALSDPTRRRILELLQQEEKTISELVEPFGMTMPAIMKHLKVLGDAGLVENHKTGRVRHCRLEEGPLVEATVWMSKQSKYWQAQFELLATFLDMQNTFAQPEGEQNELRIKTRPTQKTARPSYRTAPKDHQRAKIPRARKS